MLSTVLIMCWSLACSCEVEELNQMVMDDVRMERCVKLDHQTLRQVEFLELSQEQRSLLCLAMKTVFISYFRFQDMGVHHGNHRAISGEGD